MLSLQQVDLHTLKVLTGIATQGAISKETQKAYYVTTFKLEVSTNGEDWMVYRHGKNHKVGSESCTSTHNAAVRSACRECRVKRKHTCLNTCRVTITRWNILYVLHELTPKP